MLDDPVGLRRVCCFMFFSRTVHLSPSHHVCTWVDFRDPGGWEASLPCVLDTCSARHSGWNSNGQSSYLLPDPGLFFSSLCYYYYRYYFLVLIILGHGPFTIPRKLTCHWMRLFWDYWFRYVFWGEDSGSTNSSHCWEYKTWMSGPPPNCPSDEAWML